MVGRIQRLLQRERGSVHCGILATVDNHTEFLHNTETVQHNGAANEQSPTSPRNDRPSQSPPTDRRRPVDAGHDGTGLCAATGTHLLEEQLGQGGSGCDCGSGEQAQAGTEHEQGCCPQA